MNNPTARQQWIYDALIAAPALSFGDCFSEYSVRFSKSEVTFSKDWNSAKQRFSEYQNKANEAKERVSIALEVEGLKKGLKTKEQRLLSLQKMADKVEEEFDANEVEVSFIAEGKPVKFKRKLDVGERATLARSYKELSAEISKIEGDYPAKEVKHSGEIANPASAQVIDSIAAKLFANADKPKE